MGTKILFLIGTRPEAIKLAPMVLCFLRDPKFQVKVCLTAQHRELLDQVVQEFELPVDFDLDLMQQGQSLSQLSARLLTGLETVVSKEKPDVIVVQGDTTTAFIGALVGFYHGAKIAHVEAGLRSGDLLAPFPEEANRRLVTQLATWHFCPTEKAAFNLRSEKTERGVHVVGNTVIDALLMMIEKVRARPESYQNKFEPLLQGRRLVLLTAHRRESFGQAMEQIMLAAADIADRFKDVSILFPVHPNPNVKEAAERILSGQNRIQLIAPVSYPEMVWLLDRSSLVLTDSGGLQEEAPTLGKPIIVLREKTERPEGIDSGNALLAGTDRARIVQLASDLLSNEAYRLSFSKIANPYGDGLTSQRVLEIIGSD